MDTALLEQRSEEWRLARCGSVTASKVADIVRTNKNGSFSAKRQNYFDLLVAERLTGRPQDWKEVRSLTERAELEPDARACYTFYTGRECQIVGFIQHPTIVNAGCSPDALVGDSGMLEIKCLDPANHVKLLAGDESVLMEYLPQMHFGLACTERQWCDFLSYCPAMKDEDLKSYIRRVPRADEGIAMLENSVREFLAEVDNRVAEILRLRAGANNHIAQEEGRGVLKRKASAR